jgi:hypothetical protein
MKKGYKEMRKIIAYCGLNCAECGAYMATQNNDQALREQTAAEWTKAYGSECKPDMINCHSCKTGVLVGYCYECGVRKCASAKNVVNCGVCAEFKTCKTINDFLKQAPYLMDNLVQN